jgi:hypothetical protein
MTIASSRNWIARVSTSNFGSDGEERGYGVIEVLNDRRSRIEDRIS